MMRLLHTTLQLLPRSPASSTRRTCQRDARLLRRAQETADRRGHVSTSDVLDWLCFHLEPSQLPAKFAAGAHGTAGPGVKVVARADPDAIPPPSRCPCDILCERVVTQAALCSKPVQLLPGLTQAAMPGSASALTSAL